MVRRPPEQAPSSNVHAGNSKWTSFNREYGYDAVGNRTAAGGLDSTSYTYGPFNRLTSTNLASYSYDSNSNLTSKTVGGSTTEYAWDFENRLIQVSILGGPMVSYGYDALGRRVLRSTSNGDVQKFVYDDQDVIQDLDDSGQVVTSYLNGPGIDNKIRQTDANGNLYYLANHLGSIRGFPWFAKSMLTETL